jgi:glucan biosynthesis protein
MKRNNVVHKKKDIFIKKKKAYTKNELFNLRMNFFHQEFKFVKILQIFILITLKLNKK